MENVVPEFPHVGDFGPEVFQLPPPLVHDPPHEISTTKFELEFKRSSKTLFNHLPKQCDELICIVLYGTVYCASSIRYCAALY